MWHPMQILNAEQCAKAVVLAYPYPAQPAALLNQLAAGRGEPDMHLLLNDTSVDDFQHAANWQEVVQYLATITMENVYAYIPLLTG